MSRGLIEASLSEGGSLSVVELSGEIDVMRLVTAQRPLSDAPDAFRLALDRSQSVKVVLTAG